ncbi:hypothetical protein [Agromyces ramosus]|uniref:Lipoprotein n=1 Tax=Agromyces ramosus TaxID=33879 RepID=A0ABU0R512_9MICO|nr:hypothetical protein [Agromyces ramosus]MDQ0892827.1 hypothetical protein [Agromyces ramosus]
MPRARQSRQRRRLSLVGALVLVLLPISLVACSAAEPTSPALPDGLVTSIQQGRMDVEARQLVVRVENTTAAPVTVEHLAFTAPALEGELAYDDPFELSAGEAIAIRIDIPESRCDVPSAPGTVELAVVTGAGSATGTLTPDDPFDTLVRLNNADCLAESVAAVAEITMPEHLRSTGSGTDRRAIIDVQVTPVTSGSASMLLEQVPNTTLLGNEAGAEWPLGIEVAAGGEPFTIELPVAPARCDAHAIADDKRGTIMAFDITTSDGRAGRIDRPSGDTLKAELYAYYGERCGLQ